jgi:exodeoxyribonuclease V
MAGHHPMTSEILAHFPYEPTSDQITVIREMVAFIQNRNPSSLFLLKGYAGTGKTTMISSLVNMLSRHNEKPVLLAPTGRAAKVLASYSKEKALTIHKKIFRIQIQRDGQIEIALQENKHKNTIFIVDEASMIPAGIDPVQANLFGSSNILDDLMQYVYGGRNCRLILIGDTAQLPPVGTSDSPALHPAWLQNRYHIDVVSYEMTQVVRQTGESGILFNATLIRNMLLANQTGFPAFRISGFPDFINLKGEDIEEQIMQSFDHRNLQDSLIICRSNKRANLFNQNIRHRVLYMDDEMSSGDMLMVVKNNYYWLAGDSAAGFIANGDMVTINQIRRNEEVYGMRFADIHATMIDYPDEPVLEAKVILDTLGSASASLSNQESRNLFDAVSADYPEITNKGARMAKVRENPYFQALQVKFGYALTCHKSQGGQWRDVFIDMGYIQNQKPDKEYLRWLYTAITRATERVFLLNFPETFFE